MNDARAQRARGLLREGKTAEALAEYQLLTRDDPGRAEYWYLRSIAEQQQRLGARARESIDRALALEPGQPYFRLHSGRLAEDAGELPRAIEEFGRATQAKSDWPLAWASLGAALFEAKRAAEAVEALSRAVAANAGMVSAWNNLGLALAVLDRVDEARRAFAPAIAAEPRNAMAHLNLARLHHNRGDFDRALASATQAAQLDGRLADAHLLAGDLHRKRREESQALACYRTAAAAAPANPGGGNAVGELLWEMGALEEARREYGANSRSHPGNLKAALGERLLLPQVYEGKAQLEHCRRRYGGGLGELLADPGRFAKGRPAEVLQDIRWCNFYLAYQGRDDRELQSLYGDFVHRVLEPVVPQWLEPRPRRSRGVARIRVGFLSHFFFDCTAGRYFSSWIRRLDPARFESFVYYINPYVSDDTRRIEAAAAHFRHLPGRPVIAVAQQVLADDLDVLVYPELGMHPDTFALASLRLAPVQCAGWGHPTTTGLPTIDWFLSSEAMEPEGAQTQYR
ncbi:MAG: tetratricopeptide repeat protein, partial [Betaproteobacteria bacterium]|nr:tetratricopeptide repeat protein [Betaproteobacteria bacterium]